MLHTAWWEQFERKPRVLKKIAQKKPEHKKRTLILRGILLGALGLLFGFLCLLRTSVTVSEFMTQNVSRSLVAFGARLTSWLAPFSVFECLVLVGILYAIRLLIDWIRSLFRLKKNWFRLLKSVSAFAIAILSILCYYTVCAGYAYNRAPVALPMSGVVYQSAQYSDKNAVYTIDEIADYFYADYTALAEQFGGKDAPYDLNEMAIRLRKELKRLDENPYFFRYTPRAKTVKNSWFMTGAEIGGIAFLPTGEANVNTHPSAVSLVPIAHTMAHELAHTKGVMRENDANLVGYYILLTAEDDYLRFCGYFSCFSEMRKAVVLGSNLDSTASAKYPTPAGVAKEWAKISAFWESYKGPFDWFNNMLSGISEWLNDLYLKSNGVEKGTDSYEDFPSGGIDTGEKEPDTGKPIYKPQYNNIQKVFFAIFEEKQNA